MEPTVYTTPTPWYKRKLMWGFVLLLILIPTGSYLYASYFRKSSPPPAPAPEAETITDTDLPIALDILKNPLVYEWRGSVEGILVAKDEKSITLEKDDQRITILIDRGENGTRFSSNKATKDFRSTPLTFDDLKIGDFLRGSIWIFPKQKDQIIGNAFSVIGQ